MSGSDDCVAQVSLCGGASEAGISNGAKRRCVSKVAWFGVLESSGELIGVVEDFLSGARHRDHLRYFGRAAMAWMMIGPSVLSITPISRRLPLVSAPTNITKPSSRSSTKIGWSKAWSMSWSWMPCLRALAAMSGATTTTS